jgi:hypothetical protein
VRHWIFRAAGVTLLTSIAAIFPQPVGAQSVNGSIAGLARGADDGAPIAFAIVRLMPAASDSILSVVLTAPDGHFSIGNLPRGEYRLQLERIGYGKTVSPIVRVGAGQTVRYDLRSAATPIRLSAVKVLPGRCLGITELGEDSQLAALWGEAQKGIESRRVFDVQYRFTRILSQVVKFDRTAMPDVTRRRTDSTVNEPDSVLAQRRRALETHRAFGYVTTGGSAGLLVSLPDETELLDDEFLRDHCLETSPEQVDGVFALHFRPTGARPEGYGIRGTIWLDEHFLIRRLEFEYLKGDTARIKSTVGYADIPVAGGTLRLASEGEAAGHAEGLAMVRWVSGTFTMTYRKFELVQPD